MSARISHWYKWSLSTYKGKKLIRRYRKVNGKIKWETYPVEKYQGYSDSEINVLLNRLNASRLIEEQKAKARFDFDYSYINKQSIEDFESLLRNRTDSNNHVVTLMGYLNHYSLQFFIHQLKVPDPNLWLRYENDFSTFLLKQKKSISTLKAIVQVTNRFLKFLHRTNPNEIDLIVLDPLSKIKLRAIKVLETNDRDKFISEAHYQMICDKVDKDILPAIQIAYCFGLRVAEILGLTLDDVMEDCLDVKRQLVKVKPVRLTGPLKNKKSRSVEYWFATPTDAYHWISLLPQIHPDTLSDKFAVEMEKLKLPYQFHDFRRTFITRALRKHHIRDVQLAVGHSDPKTTMLYAQDDRQLRRKRFVPTSPIKIVK